MKSIAPQLHIILGSVSAMLVAFIALMNGTSPGTCVMKASAAFLVFAGFGLILRFALGEALEQADKSESGSRGQAGAMGGPGRGSQNLDVIAPGTSVADLLASQPGHEEYDDPALLHDGEEENHPARV